MGNPHERDRRDFIYQLLGVDAESHSIRWSPGSPVEEGDEELGEQEEPGIPQEHGSQNQLTETHGGSQRSENL